ncbi:MAG: calcium-binding protein [Tepidisphaeraceae bacterium]
MNQFQLQQMEGRTLLAASMIDGVLMVAGGAGPDTIQVEATVTRGSLLVYAQSYSIRYDVRLNGRSVWTRSIDFDGQHNARPGSEPIPRLYVDGLGGDDVLDVSAYPGSATVVGGAGNDRIHGSPYESSAVLGGRGNDTLSGSVVGGTYYDGGPGDDTITWQPGDIVHGGTGHDRAEGPLGRDDIPPTMFGSGVEDVQQQSSVHTNNYPNFGGPNYYPANSVQLRRGQHGGVDAVVSQYGSIRSAFRSFSRGRSTWMCG